MTSGPTILSLSPSHDGGTAILRGNQLVCSIEAEKDSFLRHEQITASALIETFRYLDAVPDITSIAGGIKAWEPPFLRLGVGYTGVTESSVALQSHALFGGKCDLHSCSHERAHLMCAYGMSPFEQGTKCYGLIWEGGIGRFYSIESDLTILPLKALVQMPGQKYEFIYTIAVDDTEKYIGSDQAGKVMALASYGDASAKPSDRDRELIDKILRIDDPAKFNKELYVNTHLYRCGVHSPLFHSFARFFSDALFGEYLAFAKELPEKRPLIIAGGCGLNCEWNSRFRDSGIFQEIFVPPCPNDSGIAIGAGIDALFWKTGKAKINWSVYSGQEFALDSIRSDLNLRPLDLVDCASLLTRGEIIAWVQGRCEIGPRALGNRSLLASALIPESAMKLNKIKGREDYRPIAPICLERDAGKYFAPALPSPHMLFLYSVISDNLAAVTHVDGSARLQTITDRENPVLHELMLEFARITGCGVLCNTSLNFKGRGFINSLSELVEYCKATGIKRFVVNDTQGTIP